MAKTTTINSKPTTPKDKGIDDRVKKKTSLPSGRQSVPEIPNIFNNKITSVTPNQLREIIPIIRALMKVNGDVGQAIHNIVTLGNTGHKIFFDRKRTPDQVDAMRNHLMNRRKEWASGQAGADGITNRLIAQILVGGALSAEAVPNSTLTGVESIILVNPEDIEFQLDQRGTKYIPFQRVKTTYGNKSTKNFGLVPLNTNTYKYFALNGDGELPYGFPPYMSVIGKVETQRKMDKNINYVVDQMGLMGFIEALIQKPDQGTDAGDESDANYEKRLDDLLTKAKTRLLEGFKEGVVVGFKDDHEFKFNSASKTYTDAVELYKNNELMLASSLKQDASMWGRSYATSETQITVVFIKMLSELRNIQTIVNSFWGFVYSMELTLAGFEFDYLEVKSNRSTIQDDLKSQQAEEIKVRNVTDKLILGIISQDQAADELGYEVPAFSNPMVPWEILAGGSLPPAPETGLKTDATKKKADTKKKKTASATKKRQQAKILPK